MVTFEDAKNKCLNPLDESQMLHRPASDGEITFFKKYFQNDEFWEINDIVDSDFDTKKNAICFYRVSGKVKFFSDEFKILNLFLRFLHQNQIKFGCKNLCKQ